jgi:hypothetical protein
MATGAEEPAGRIYQDGIAFVRTLQEDAAKQAIRSLEAGLAKL